MKNMSKRGLFVLFEGVDRCGKSTQSKNLVTYLQNKGVTAEWMCFPDRTTEIGKMINGYLTNSKNLDDKATHLLFSANRWENVARIEDALKNGRTIVCDRYAFSGVAFTSAKGLDVDWCKQPDVGLPRPDIVFFLDIAVEDAAKRGEFGEERYESIDFQKKVRKQFELLKEPDWKVMDATRSPQDLEDEIRQITDQALESDRSQQIPKLWV